MEDTRCCGTGTCIINAEGFCWCGQRWDGTRMCFPDAAAATPGGELAGGQAQAAAAGAPPAKSAATAGKGSDSTGR